MSYVAFKERNKLIEQSEENSEQIDYIVMK